MHFCSHEEIIPAELCTEHHRHTDLQHVSHLARVIKEVVVFRVGVLLQLHGGEAVPGSGIEETEVQTCLKQEMSVFQVIGYIQPYARAAFELLQRVALVQRLGACPS